MSAQNASADADNVVNLLQPVQRSEDDIANIFVSKHGNDFKYISDAQKWAYWSGSRWERDQKNRVLHRIRMICREQARVANGLGRQTKLSSQNTVASVARMASADPRCTMLADEFDADKFLLNTPDGYLDLAQPRPKLCPHDRGRYMMRMAGATPDTACPTPYWTAFLNTVCGGDQELIAFLQRVTGYSLTGSVQEHALFFLYGGGANGKSTFINVLTQLLGDYHRASAMDAFLEKKFQSHSTEIADLAGARLVTASENDRGTYWAEARIKALTGGDMQSVRFMRENQFLFTPQFKLLVSGNSKPAFRGVDEGLRRRVHLIPFVVTIPAEKRDPELGDKLKAELRGIMAWAVEGAGQWRERGLCPPQGVKDATEEYMAAQDTFGAWMEERTIKELGTKYPVGELYASWQRWCAEENHPPGSKNNFGEELDKRGFPPARTKLARVRLGIRLRNDSDEER